MSGSEGKDTIVQQIAFFREAGWSRKQINQGLANSSGEQLFVNHTLNLSSE